MVSSPFITDILEPFLIAWVTAVTETAMVPRREAMGNG
jgi:hypothetical protein